MSSLPLKKRGNNFSFNDSSYERPSHLEKLPYTCTGTRHTSQALVKCPTWLPLLGMPGFWTSEALCQGH